jgi:hypothetical protein
VIRRVPVGENEHICPFRVGSVYQRRLPGVNGRPSFRVTAEPREQKLRDVTHREVITEEGGQGRRALEKWRLEWVRRHDKGWARRHLSASDAEIMVRWRTHHAARLCWVLELDLLDSVRCMADQRDILSGRTQHGHASGESDQYVSSGGIDPYAEAVDPGTLARIVAGELTARSEDGLSRAERRRLRYRRLFEGDQL